MLQKTTHKFWPKDLPEQLKYRLGEKPLHVYLHENAVEFPNEIAYVFYGNEITWKKLNDDINRFAQFLVNKGIKKGDRVSLFLQNSPQYLIGHYAIQRIGAIVVPLNPMYKESELEYFINEAEVKAILSDQEICQYVLNAKSNTPSLEIVISTSYSDYLPLTPIFPVPEELKGEKKNIEGTYDLLEVIQNTPPLKEFENIDLWNDVCLLTFTSGSTGRPKGAMLTYGNCLFKTAAGATVSYYRENTKTVSIAPFCHIAGMLMGVNIPVYSRCMSVILSRFDPEAAISAVEKYKVDNWYTITIMNYQIMNYPGVKQRDLSSLKRNTVTSFGLPLTEEFAKEWSDLTGGCTICEAAYGLSETHTADTFMPSNRIKYGSCGIPTYETTIRIVDLETGEDLPPGKQGEIVVKNPGVFKGYLNRPDATMETLRDGWVYTGDIGEFDEDGYLYFIGRVKEMIKCSGYSVFPEDVEALMSEHEAVVQVAVIGIPDPIRGESVKAFVVLKPEYKGKITENEMIEWAKQHMAAYKYPRHIEFRDELPTTKFGKILRRVLKEETLNKQE